MLMIRKSHMSCTTKRVLDSLWQRCRSVRALMQIHACMVIDGFNSNTPALRELIFTAVITVSGVMDYAHQLFEHIVEPDLFMWNTMIRGFAQSSNPSIAISIYTQMQKQLVRPDHFTFPFLLKACTRLSSFYHGNRFHGQIVKFGFESDLFVRNTLIHFQASCGSIEVARKLFNEVATKDLVSWNVMITGYAKRGEMDSARRLFGEIPERDVVSWNAMIAGYVLCGFHNRALEVFEEMQLAGERPNDVTMLSLLSACAESGALDVGKRIHSSLRYTNCTDLSVALGNALIDMYAKCGCIESAFQVFRGMRGRDVSTWNSIIGGLAFHGHFEDSISVFMEMQRQKARPDAITFVGLLVACSHGGLIEDGHKYFDLMRIEYGITPDIKHYGCMVDMLGRAGLLNEAFEFVETMSIEPNAIIWRTLLGACRIHDNVELGQRATEQLLRLRRDQSGDYVLLSNIYASAGGWDGVERVRKLMEEKGVRKQQPGFSLIEADQNELMHFLLDSKPKQDSTSIFT